MSKYTKGKWEVLPDGLTIRAKIAYKPHYDAEPPQAFIAKCFQNDRLGRNERPTEEDRANAHRIVQCVNEYDSLKAKADSQPTLLAACEKFKFTPDCGGNFCIDEDGTWWGETTTQEKCPHIGYCKWAYKQSQNFKAAIAAAKE